MNEPMIGSAKVAGGFAIMANDALVGVAANEREAALAVEVAKRYAVIVSEWRRRLPSTTSGGPIREASDDGGNVPVRTATEGEAG